MTATLPPLERIAAALGGEVSGGQVRAPGPGHSTDDRSLSVRIDADAPDGFVAHSFAGDDAIKCKDYVRDKLRLPPFEAKKKKNGKASGSWGPLLAEYVYRDKDGRPYLRVRKYRDASGKKQFPQSHWDGEKWIEGAPAGPKIPYRLPELIAGPLTSNVYFCEGEKDCEALAKQSFVATTQSGGAGAKWDSAMTAHFKDRRVVILPDADGPGRQYAEKVAVALDKVAASIKVIELYPECSDGSDVSDFLETDAVAVKLMKTVNDAPEWQPAVTPIPLATTEDQALLIELAGLSPLDFAKRRKVAAQKLGITPGDLERLVVTARAELVADKLVLLEGYEHWSVEIWPEPVEGHILFRALVECLRRFVVMSEEQATANALWIVYSYLHESKRFATHSPLLLVRSAEKDSGKTTLLGVVCFLIRRGFNTVEISGPALFRSIAKWAPSFVVDEADDALESNPDLRKVINSGWTRGQAGIKCHPVTFDPEAFSTFGPKAVGMKGSNIPDTTLSRSIVIDMKPKLASEEIADFDHLDQETFARLRQQILRWATDNAEALAAGKPEIPANFRNRRRANWRPLLAIAELMGGEVKTKAWAAANAIELRQSTSNPSTGVQLLRDIRKVFRGMEAGTLVAGQEDKDRLTTGKLVMELNGLPDSPWLTYRHDKDPITAGQVSRLLKPYGIRPSSVKIPTTADKTSRGYLLAWFEDTFARHLPAKDDDEENDQEESAAEILEGENPASKPKTPDTSLKSQDLLPKKTLNLEPQVSGLKTAKDQCFQSGVGGLGLEGGFSGPKNFSGDDETLADSLPEDSHDHTCAQCQGVPDGKERLRIIAGVPVWLHSLCESFYRKAPYRLIGPTAPGTTCIACHSAEGEVHKVARSAPGSKSETLHLACAARWFGEADMSGLLRQFQRQRRGVFKRMLRRGSLQGRRVSVTIEGAFYMLLDPRLGFSALELLGVATASAYGEAERQDCFVCLQPWSDTRRVEAIGCAEFIKRQLSGQPGQALMFGICGECCRDRAAVMAAIKRDFGECTVVSPIAGNA